MKKLLTVAVLLFSLNAFAQQYDRSKVDFRMHGELDKIAAQVQNSDSRFFKSSGGALLAEVIVFSSSTEDAKSVGVQPLAHYPGFYTARIDYAKIVALSNLQSTVYIQAPKIRKPLLDKSLLEMKVDKLHSGQVNSTVYKGKNIIIGVIDSGIDWKHLDFRSNADTTKTRILFLWDQTDARSSIGPVGFNYGAEYDATEINNELDGTPVGFVQEQDFSGHGTHVASTAAGDGSVSAGKYTGVAPEADLIIVKAGDEGFSTTNIINGITFIRQKAVAAGKPFVINMSLGGHDGSHDGTQAEEVTIDTELNNATGRQIVVAAGNEGSDPIYGGATLTNGATKVFTFTIPAYTPNGGTTNDYALFSMWYKNGDNFNVAVKTPNNTTVQVNTGLTTGSSTANGRVQIFNGNAAANSKGAKECVIEIFDVDAGTPPTAGTWTITVTGGVMTQGGAFDIWIAGSSIVGNSGDVVEFASGHSFAKLVGMPGTAENGITVGSYVTKWGWTAIDGFNYAYNGADRTNNFSTFSSMGPTRDGRQKPDISAPGQAIGAARSSSASFSTPVLLAPSSKYVIEQGTSMAAPHVAGLVALMLQAKPTISSSAIRSALNATARKDGFTGVSATAQWGNGKVDAQAVLQNILSVELESELVPATFALHQNYPNPFNPNTKISFSVPQGNLLTLKVYSVLGEEIATLVNEFVSAGEYSSRFDGTGLASGMYFYTLSNGSKSMTKKMLLLK